MDSFYADQEGQRKQIKMHHYADRDNFLISITGNIAPYASLECFYSMFYPLNEVMYFLKSDEKLTMDEVVKRVMNSDEDGKPIEGGDSFEMPVISLEASNSFKELTKTPFKNKGLEDYEIAEMVEALKLKVDEEGGTV